MNATSGFGADGFFDERSTLTPSQLAQVLVAAPLLPRVAQILEELIEQANQDRAAGEPELALSLASGYPLWFLLADAAASRAFGCDHQYRAETTHGRRNDLYLRLRELAWQIHEVALPRTAPSRDVSRSLRNRLAQPDLIELFRQAFYRACRELAHDLGALLPPDAGKVPNAARLRLFNLLIGDGTIVREFSAVTPMQVDGVVVDYQYTRALRDESGQLVGKPRVQRWRTATAADGKGDKLGINFVHIGTETAFGFVVLAADMAHGGEAITAMQLLEKLLADPEVSADAVLYDRAITGHHAERLLGVYGVPVISQPVANTDSKVATPELVTRATMVKNEHLQRARRIRAAAQRRAGKKDATAATVQLPKAVREWTEQEAVRQLRAENPGPYPLGVAYRPEKNGAPTFVHTWVEEFDIATHTVDGATCGHRLVVDDTVLWSVGPDGLKSTPVTLTRVAMIEGPGGTHTQRATFGIPCEHGAFDWVDEFTPNINGKPTSGERKHRTPKDKARSTMRVYALLGEIHETVKGRRSIAESWNNWLKAHLGPVGQAADKSTGRAKSLNPDQQLLDYLFTALAFNADKWHRAHRGTQRDAENPAWS